MAFSVGAGRAELVAGQVGGHYPAVAVHASGEQTDPIETRRKRVDAEATRLAGLGGIITGALSEEGLDHYAVGMKDPEGNEFDIN